MDPGGEESCFDFNSSFTCDNEEDYAVENKLDDAYIELELGSAVVGSNEDGQVMEVRFSFSAVVPDYSSSSITAANHSDPQPAKLPINSSTLQSHHHRRIKHINCCWEIVRAGEVASEMDRNNAVPVAMNGGIMKLLVSKLRSLIGREGSFKSKFSWLQPLMRSNYHIMKKLFVSLGPSTLPKNKIKTCPITPINQGDAALLHAAIAHCNKSFAQQISN